MFQTHIKKLLFLFCLSLAFNAAAQCSKVYTIGDYQVDLIVKGMVVKLGPVPLEDVNDMIPISFLEPDGHYAGGEAFCSIEAACKEMRILKNKGILPAGNWRIYELQATWDQDVYRLSENQYRINKEVKVLAEVHQC